MAKIVIPEYLPDEFQEQLADGYEVIYDPDLYADRPRLLAEVADAVAIVIRNRTQVNPEFLAAAHDLRVIGRLGAGLDNLDMAACATAHALVIPAYGGNAVSVAEYVMGAMLALTRDIFSLTDGMVAGTWPRQGYALGEEIMGKTLGVIGYGAIGSRVGLRAEPMEMRVLANDPYIADDDHRWETAESAGFEQLLEEADFVTVHTPLNDETHNLIDAAALELMKPSAFLINTSRGGTVDEAALARALRTGGIAGAALDVFTEEPLGPKAAATFAGLDNIILTPHIAGNTAQSIDRVAQMTVDAVLAELEDR